MIAALIIVAVACVMEPVTTYIHRTLMHKTMWIWHKSHHDREGKSFEYNDYFPIVFSVVAISLFVIGIRYPLVRYIAVGITLYGFLYFIVHEIIIHSRFGRIRHTNRLFRYWRRGHNIHHQYHQAPYGFIVPIIPPELEKKSQSNPRDLITRYGHTPQDSEFSGR